MDLPSYNCVLWNNQIEESLQHLFILCPFASACCNLVNVQISSDLDPFECLDQFNQQLNMPFFMEIIIIMCWSIWKARNDLIFQGIQPSVLTSKSFKSEFSLFTMRAKRNYFPLIDTWIENLV
jgi:hypothetical protein